MKTLRDYVVTPALYLRDTGVEAQVGDQVKLYLDTDAIPNLPEFVVGVVQHPITKLTCPNATSYNIEYNEADLGMAADLIRSGHIIDAVVVTSQEVLADALDSEIARATAAEALLAPKASPTFTGTVVLPNTTTIGSVSSTELSYIDGVTSSIQSQLNAKAAVSSPSFTGYPKLPIYTAAGIVSAVTAGAGAKAFVSDADATTFHSVVVAGGANFVPVFSDGTNWRIG
jgi:hypothetical protein